MEMTLEEMEDEARKGYPDPFRESVLGDAVITLAPIVRAVAEMEPQMGQCPMCSHLRLTVCEQGCIWKQARRLVGK